MRLRVSSAPAAWARSIAPAIRGSIATSRSRFFRRSWRAIRQRWRGSNAKRMSVAKLSHPNILSIYEFASDGRHGLRRHGTGRRRDTARAARDRRAAARKRAVAYALQIARGIAAAHARGLVHRDLKPENVMITRDDQVKILDFGLAKPIDPASRDETPGAGIATSAGTVLGTFGYMAPEQVRGLAVDQRADIFAFGAVLYEMLSGERAFKGETAADTMTAILTKEPPDLDTARLAISAGLDRIVRRCLEKSPDLRFQSANDLAFALDTLSTASSGDVGVASGRASTPAGAGDLAVEGVHVAAVDDCRCVAVLAAGAIWLLQAAPRRAPEPRVEHFTRITEAAGEETSPSLSPDGSTVAYAVRVNGSWDIYVAARRRAERDADRQRSAARRTRARPSHPTDRSSRFTNRTSTAASSSPARPGSRCGGSPISASIPRGPPTESRSRLRPKKITTPPDARATARSMSSTPRAGRRGRSSTATRPAVLVARQAIGSSTGATTAGSATSSPCRSPAARACRSRNDPAIDWSPVWSPDGQFIYFSSDRGGAMNLWRIAVEPSTGQSRHAVPVTTGVQATASLPRCRRTGVAWRFDRASPR